MEFLKKSTEEVLRESWKIFMVEFLKDFLNWQITWRNFRTHFCRNYWRSPSKPKQSAEIPEKSLEYFLTKEIFAEIYEEILGGVAERIVGIMVLHFCIPSWSGRDPWVSRYSWFRKRCPNVSVVYPMNRTVKECSYD